MEKCPVICARANEVGPLRHCYSVVGCRIERASTLTEGDSWLVSVARDYRFGCCIRVRNVCLIKERAFDALNVIQREHVVVAQNRIVLFLTSVRTNFLPFQHFPENCYLTLRTCLNGATSFLNGVKRGPERRSSVGHG